jgi:chaperonin cofactor prefoldin
MSQEELQIQQGDIVAIHAELLRTYTSPFESQNKSRGIKMVQVSIGSTTYKMPKSNIAEVVERKESPEAKAERCERERDAALGVQQQLAQIIDDLHARIDTLEAQIKNEREVFRRGPYMTPLNGGLVGWPVSPPVTASDMPSVSAAPTQRNRHETIYITPSGDKTASELTDEDRAFLRSQNIFVSSKNFGVTPPEGYTVVLQESMNANSPNPTWTDVEPEAPKPWYPEQLEGYSEWREGPPPSDLRIAFNVLMPSEREAQQFTPFLGNCCPSKLDWSDAVAHCLKL